MSQAAFPIPDLLRDTVTRCGNTQALATIRDGELHWQTWSELEQDVVCIADRLEERGVSIGDRVVQIAPNSYEWIVVDLAILSLGAVHVPLHASLSVAQAAALLERADAQLAIVPDQNSGLSTPQIAYPELFNGRSVRAVTTKRTTSEGALRSASYTLQIDPDSLATILFTSGTTGTPRGVMLSHRNLIENCGATAEAVGAKTDETRLAILPFSHIYARTCDLYSWLMRGTKLVLAESRETILRDCQLAKPTVINAVPYLYQKIAQGLRAAGKVDEPGAIHQLLGGNIKRCFCGGAAVAPEVETLFEQQGLPILSGYGLTEAAPVVTATRLENYRPGTVGRPLPNLDVKLSDQREIMVRGPSVMQGYWQDEDPTDQSVVDGWLHTGDLGEFDSEGNLRIVGREKEIIVLATGKNVSPMLVEGRLTSSPLIEHVCVVGDGRNCLAALIVPNPDALRSEIRSRRLWVWSKRRAVTHPKVRALFRAEMDRLLSDLGHEEQIGPFAILPRNFSSEAGELTPKLSLCRAAIQENYERQIERMYRDSPRGR